MANVAAVLVAKKAIFGSKGPSTVTPKQHQFIKQVKVGEALSGVYYLEAFFEKTARTGNKYTEVVLRDKSGSATNVKFWGVFTAVAKNNYVEITATVEEYQGQPQIIISKVKQVAVPTDLNNYQAMSSSNEDDQHRFGGLSTTIQKSCTEAKDCTCLDVLNAVFTDEVKSKFVDSPASVQPFYGMVGGLLAHTIKTSRICADFAQEYQFTEAEKAVVLTAALIHAVGGVDAFEMKDCAPAETLRGALYGTSLMTLEHFSSAVDMLKRNGLKLNEETLARLEHAVAAGVGAVKPMTKEAIVLSEVNRIDHELSEAANYIAQDTNKEKFTAYDPILKRRFLK